MSRVITQKIDLSRHLYNDGPKFLSHVITINENQASLKPTFSAVFFCLIYVVVGIFLLVLSGIVYVKNQQLDLTIFLISVGIAIATFGFTLLKPFVKRASFNKTTNEFVNFSDRNVKLANIISLQITNKMVQRKHGLTYPCYELNMLTKFGRRVNILNHNDLQQMQHDGELLANFLNVPFIDCQKEIQL